MNNNTNISPELEVLEPIEVVKQRVIEAKEHVKEDLLSFADAVKNVKVASKKLVGADKKLAKKQNAKLNVAYNLANAVYLRARSEA